MEVKEEKIEPEISKPPVVQVSEQQKKKKILFWGSFSNLILNFNLSFLICYSVGKKKIFLVGKILILL